MLYRCKACDWSAELRSIPKSCPKCKVSRTKKVHPGVLKTRRLISWITFYGKYFRPQDKGVGDTTEYLRMKSCDHPDTFKQLDRLLTQCDCTTETAVEKLNTKYPY